MNGSTKSNTIESISTPILFWQPFLIIGKRSALVSTCIREIKSPTIVFECT